MNGVCPVCGGAVASTDDVCPQCGFKLAGSTQEFEPISLDGEGVDVRKPAKKAQSATLTIVRGPQLGTVYTLDDKEQTIGRDPSCDIFLNDMTVSREHAIVAPKQGKFCIRDCSSYNGIWINNENVEEAALATDDIIQIGTFCLLYEE